MGVLGVGCRALRAESGSASSPSKELGTRGLGMRLVALSRVYLSTQSDEGEMQ